MDKLDKYLEIGEIISKSFLTAAGISTIVVVLCLVLGGNLAPVAGVIYGSIAFLTLFVLFLFTGILCARGFTKMSAYSVVVGIVCLVLFVIVIARTSF